MLVSVLKSKLFRARITEKHLSYEGSLGVDERLMHAVGFAPYEKVLVANISNGQRLETYVIPAPPETGAIRLLGAACRLGEVGDELIVMSFALVSPDEEVVPQVATLDEKNRIISRSP